MYPHMTIDARVDGSGNASTNTAHGPVFSFVQRLSTSGYRRFSIGTAAYNGDKLSFGYADNNANPHYGMGVDSTGAMMYLTTSAQLIVNGSVNTPTVYDKNNTAYYADHAGTSKMNILRLAGHLAVGGHTDSSPATLSTSARITFGTLSADATSNYSIGTNLENYGGNYNKLDLAFHTGIRLGAHPNYGGVRFYADQSMATEIFAVGKSGNYVQAANSLRAPIFYDANDTAFYIDPHSTGTSFKGQGTTDSKAGFKSTANPWNTSDSAFFPNGITTNNTTNWIYGSCYLGNAPSNGNGNLATAAGTIESTSWHKASLYYDRDNTAFYVDPTGATNLQSTTSTPALKVTQTSAGGNNIGSLFQNATGNFAWGCIAEYRIAGATGTDRPSIIFSTAYNSNTWSAGFGYTDDNFRIKIDHGHRNGGWGTAKMTLDRSGNVTFAGNVTAYSDERLKTDIKTIENPLDAIKQLRGVTFKWKESGDESIGLIAQEVEKVDLTKCLVSETAEDGNGDINPKNVAYGNMVGLLVEAVKELTAKVETLETKLSQKEK